MDWKLCIICQLPSKETLQCPGKSKRKDSGAGYVSFARILKEYDSLGIQVTHTELLVNSQDQPIEQLLLENNACWHKSCRDRFNNTKLERAKKRKLSDVEKDEEVVQSVVSPVKATRSICGRYNPQSQCFFCEEANSLENLHAASTKEVDKKVRECAGLLNDGKLIAKLSGGDLIAIEAKYHSKCLAGLYNRARSYRLQAIKPSVHPLCEPNELAFAQLLAYIEEQLETEEPVLLTLSDLVKFYMCKLRELFGEDCGTVNSTHLKERILDVFPDLTAHTKDRNKVHLVLIKA